MSESPLRSRVYYSVGGGFVVDEQATGRYVLQMRVEAARRQLERTDRGLKHVASAAGFGSVDVMRRAFVRRLGITPRRYRELAEHPTRD